jgi:hypothetical protein
MSLRLTAALLPFVVMSKEVVTLAADAEPPTAKNSAEESRAAQVARDMGISRETVYQYLRLSTPGHLKPTGS